MARSRNPWRVALLAGAVSALAGEAPSKTVRVIDETSHRPLAQLAVEVTSQVVSPCIRAPCPPQSETRWKGTTDAHGRLRYPATLEANGAIAFVHAVGSNYSADVHGDSKDRNGVPIVRLRRPAEVPKP